jgi:predicted enzyme related to lactoylglutathione lyase
MEQTTQPRALIKGVDLFANMVSDPQRAIAFYRDVLGMTPTDIDEQGRGAEFTLADGSTFGVWKSEEGQPVPSGGVMFAVDDIAEAVATFRARGLAISDPMESPVCHMAFGSDPDGNVVIIHKRKLRD